MDLVSFTAANGNTVAYDYNNAHDVIGAAFDGVTETFTRNAMGNVTASTLSGGSITLQSTAAYSADGDHTTRIRNVNNQLVEYTYSTNDERLLSASTKVLDANNNEVVHSKTEYTYDNAGRTTKTELSDASAASLASINYTYSGGNLTALARTSKYNNVNQTQTYNLAYNAWGQLQTFKVGSQTLTTNYYEVNGGNLYGTVYGNGQYVEYTYDEFDRLIRALYTTGRYIEYSYNAEGALSKLAYGDGATAKGSYQFEYDSLGRLIRSTEFNGSGTLVQRTEHNYDAYNRLQSQKWVLGSKSYSESYSYSDGASGDGSLTQMTTGTGYTLNYTYDSLKRLQKTQVKDGTTVKFTTAYAYRTISGNQSSTQVEFRNVRAGGDTGTLLEGAKYTYDARGNITMISKSTGSYYPLVAYEYDSQNQLTKETYYDGTGTGLSHITDTYVYTYDTAGNIQTVKKNGITTQTYTYSTGNWKDLLTAVNGNSIVYDNSGNPTAYRRGTSTAYDLTWTNGRQLSSVGCYDEQWQVSYSYDADGIRTEKYDDGVSHKYITQNGKVVRETIGSGSTAKVLDFIYDESGRPFALNYSTNNGSSFTTYYYILNLQGDVVKLVNASGTSTFATYTYDAWGNLLSSSGSLASVNPLRYRGYYYDAETGWYYLQSRYYDPVIHRFINADSFASTGQGILGTNMFAYCNNNPVTHADPSGRIIVIADGATEEELAQYERAIEYLMQSPTGASLIDSLEKSDVVITVILATTGETIYNYSSRSINFNVYRGIVMIDEISVQSASLSLAHEMGHAADHIAGRADAFLNSDDKGRDMWAYEIEQYAVKKYETPIAKELGEPFRENYLDHRGIKIMNNSTHYQTKKDLAWWEYIFPWNWFGTPIDEHNKY